MTAENQVQVVYSQGARFAGGGIGSTAYHAVHGLAQQHMLARLLCGSYNQTEIPDALITAFGLPNRALRKLAQYDSSGRIAYYQTSLYDDWASGRLKAADLFHVWGNYGLRSLRKAHDQGMVTMVERASALPRVQAEILAAEYSKWRLAWRPVADELNRAEAELEAADYILVPSPFAYESFVKNGFPDSKIRSLPFGVDVTRFQPASEREPSPFRVLFVGQLGLRKGVLYLLQAWERLHWENAELWLVGNTDASFRQFRHLLRLPGVRAAGYTADPLRCYQNADLFVFPSLEEGSALVTYEALACGLPVITTYQSGSVVRDGTDGWIVPVCDAGSLAERMQLMRNDNALRARMAAAARERALEYPWTRYEQQYVKLCTALVRDGAITETQYVG
ncbi:MAG: glycosyltransferase family 4 protein [Chloroflexi bacterium]|nr:glycosyltransferase family 4 protein [Chloroflexota bacterium]